MCAEWRADFTAFLAHIGQRPTPKHSVDRIDNEKGYEPGNVRWATVGEQSRNRRANIWLEYDGRRQCLTDWAVEFGLSKTTLWQRIRFGLTVADALTRPRQWKKDY